MNDEICGFTDVFVYKSTPPDPSIDRSTMTDPEFHESRYVVT